MTQRRQSDPSPSELRGYHLILKCVLNEEQTKKRAKVSAKGHFRSLTRRERGRRGHEGGLFGPGSADGKRKKPESPNLTERGWTRGRSATLGRPSLRERGKNQRSEIKKILNQMSARIPREEGAPLTEGERNGQFTGLRFRWEL